MDLTNKKTKTALCFGFTIWKQPIMAMFFRAYRHIKFMRFSELSSVLPKNDEEVFIWASTLKDKHVEILSKNQVKYTLVEDGFIRSRGLGIKLNYPASLCFSNESIHYDCSKPSELENKLNTSEYTDEQREIGDKIIDYILSNNITKYGLTNKSKSWSNPNKHNVLVIGQVGDDASVKTGSPKIQSNQQAIVEARRLFPISNIAYKPHPDVVAKLRLGAVSEKCIENCINVVLEDDDLISAIKEADTVITMSSQAGLDALLLGKHVVCLGAPFYSGWGLTEDRLKNNRRQRTLKLNELIYTCFYDYPNYINPQTGEQVDIFKVIDLIKDTTFSWPHAPSWMRIFVKFKRAKRKALAFRKRVLS